MAHLALQARPPLREDSRPLPKHVAEAIHLRAVTEITPESHRSTQLQKIQEISKQFPIKDDSPRLDLIAHLAKLAGSPDIGLAKDSSKGFTLIGEQPLTGLWEVKKAPNKMSKAELSERLERILAKHRQLRDSGEYRLPSKSQQPKLLAQLREEAQKG